MRAVVAADAEDVAQRARQRRGERDGRQRQARAGCGRGRPSPRAIASMSGKAPRDGIGQRERRRFAPVGRHEAHMRRPPQLQLAMRIWRCLRPVDPAWRPSAGRRETLFAVSEFETCVSNVDRSIIRAASEARNNNRPGPRPGISRMPPRKPHRLRAAQAPEPRRQGRDLEAAAGDRHAADPAGRPHPLGGRGGGALQRLARHRVPLLPEPQRAGHRGGRHLARAGAQLQLAACPTAARGVHELFKSTFPRFKEFEPQLRAAAQLTLEQWALERAGLLEEEPYRRGHRVRILEHALEPLAGHWRPSCASGCITRCRWSTASSPTWC